MENYQQAFHRVQASLHSERGRLLVLIVALVMPFLVVVWQLNVDLQHQIRTVQREQASIPILRSLDSVMIDGAISRQLTHRHLEYEKDTDTPGELYADIDANLNRIAALLSTYNITSRDISRHLSAAQTTWNAIQQERMASPNLNNPVSRSVTDSNLREQHQQLIEQLRTLITEVGDEFGLVLDPVLDVSYLTQVVLSTLPNLQTQLAQLLLTGEDVVRKKALPPSAKRGLIEQVGTVQARIDRVQQLLNAALRYSPTPDLEAAIAPPLAEATDTIQTFLKTVTTYLIDAEAIALPLMDYNATADAAFQASQDLWHPTLTALESRLEQRFQPVMRRYYGLLAFAGMVLVAIGGGGSILERTLTQHRQTEQQLKVQYVITKILAECDTIEAAAPQILEAMGTHLHWDVGELWQFDATGQSLVITSAWASSPDLQAMLNRPDWEIQFSRGVGLAGQVWETLEPIWIEHLDTESCFVRTAIAQSLGVKSVCGFPILDGTTLVGVLSLFNRIVQHADPDVYAIMIAISQQIGQFIKTTQAEQALRRNEAFQSIALSAASMGAWDWDICTGAETWSPECEQVFGLRPGTFSGHYLDFLRMVHPDDRDSIEAAQRHTLEHNADYAPEYRIICPDSSIRWLTSRGSLVRDESGRPLHLTGIVMDITDRKEAEQALIESDRRVRQAEEKYRSIFENAITGIFQTTPDGHFTSANPALARIYGYESVEAMMASLSNIERQLYVNPQRRQDFMELMSRQGRVSNFEAQIYRNDGEIIWIAEYAIAIQSDEGDVVYFEGTVEDITDRKQAQAALRESEERFRTLLTNIPGAFYRCALDSDWTMEFLSDYIYDICGYPAEDFIQNRIRSFADIIPDEDNQRINQVIGAAVQQKQPYVLEYRMVHANGSIRWVYEKGQAIFRNNGEAQCLDGVIFDITDRKRAEQFQTFQKQTLEAIASGCDLTDTLTLLVKAIEDQSQGSFGAIALMSKDRQTLHIEAATSLPQTSIDAIGSLPIGDGLTSCGTAAYRKTPIYVSDIANSPEWTKDPNVALNAGLRSCWSQPILSSQDEVLGTVAIYHPYPASPTESDQELLTTIAHLAEIAIERCQTEAELYRAKTVAEESNRAKSQFLANMSHELRTPLNAIIGYSEMLQEEVDELETAEFGMDLAKIQQAGKHLLALINDILDISKIEAGRMELCREPVDLYALIRDVKTTIQPLVAKGYNQLEIHCSDQIGTMQTDAIKLRQVLLNLLSNAAKFTEHGRIVLEVDTSIKTGDRLSILTNTRTDTAGDWIAIRVVDTGIGMTSNQLQRVFQPFIQADASTTRRYGGTGLGLAISHHFCQMMGGDIEAQSVPGEGSTFTVYLPRHAPSDDSMVEAIAPPVHLLSSTASVTEPPSP